MFNFLVTAEENAWEQPDYYDRVRFCEHTNEELAVRFKSLDDNAIGELLTIPALFAYEGNDEIVRVGRLTEITRQADGVQIEYHFDPDINEFRFSRLEERRDRMNIGKWEMRRTHWAIKEGNLYKFLNAAGIIDRPLLHRYLEAELPPLTERRFLVALSFPGEKRNYVSRVAERLKSRLPPGAVFYDNDYTAHLARPNLDNLLQRIYLENSKRIVVFLSAEYGGKPWCGLEWRAIREHIKAKDDERIILVRFDESKIPSIFSTDGYIDANKYEPEQTADFIFKRI